MRRMRRAGARVRAALDATEVPTGPASQVLAATADALRFRQAPGWLPRGRRVYAIGDVHGAREQLVILRAAIAADLAARPIASAVLVHLGDYIDLGPDSAGVVALLADGPPVPGVTTVNLMGDHEHMLLAALAGDRAAATDWLWAGGRAALASWGIDPDLPRESWEAALPASHVGFLRNLLLSHRECDYLFVHAGIRPDVALADQAAGRPADDAAALPLVGGRISAWWWCTDTTRRRRRRWRGTGSASIPAAGQRRTADLRRAGGRRGRLPGGMTAASSARPPPGRGQSTRLASPRCREGNMRRLGLLVAIFLAVAWCVPARAQFIDQDKSELAKKLNDAWLSDTPEDATVQVDGIGLCVQDGKLYGRDRLIDKAGLVKRVAITMQGNKQIALKFLQTEALEMFLRSIPYLSDCKTAPAGAFANTFLLVTAVDGHTKLSELWDLLKKH